MQNLRNNKPLVVHIIDRLPPDGAERLLVDILKNRSDKFEYRVICIIEGGGLQPEIESLGVPVELLTRQSRWDFGLVIRLANRLKQLDARVVHTHLFTADAWGRVASRIAGIKAVFSTVHSTNDWMSDIHNRIDRFLAKYSYKVIACSDKVEKVLLNERHYPAEKIVCIANGVDTARFEGIAPLDLKVEFGIGAGVPVFALIGRLHEAKGHSFIIPVLEKLAESGEDFRFLIVGEGNLEEDIKALVAQHQLTDKVVFAGFRKDVPSILKSLDFLIMPSRWEGLPMSLLESMVAETPVLASTVGGIPTVIADQQDGMLLDKYDEAGWLSALSRCCKESSFTRKMGVKAKEKIYQKYSAKSVQAQYENLYQEALRA